MKCAEFEMERYLRRYMWQRPLLGLEQKPNTDSSLRFVGDILVSRLDEQTGKSSLVPPAGPIWERLNEELQEELRSGRDDRLMDTCVRDARAMLREYMWAHPLAGARRRPGCPQELLWVGEVPVALLYQERREMILTPFGEIWEELSGELVRDLRKGVVTLPAVPRAGSGQPNST
jgi:hypothetical protein